MVEMAQLRVVPAQFESLAVLQSEGHAAVCDREDLGGAAVDQPEPDVVSGPANSVPGLSTTRC